jgi:Transposase DDE domain group 1
MRSYHPDRLAKTPSRVDRSRTRHTGQSTPGSHPEQGASILNVNADLKNSALAHLPSGVFTANAAWLVLAVIAFNLTRAAATIAGTGLAKATTATIRRKLVTVPARIASSARRITLHLPDQWPWELAWTALLDHVGGSPPPVGTT